MLGIVGHHRSKKSQEKIELEAPVNSEQRQSQIFLETHIERTDTGQAKGLVVTFKNLSYYVLKWKSPTSWSKERKYLLKTVTANFTPKHMTALMGPSGCGKTTLMDVLAGRKTSGVIEGDVTYGYTKPSLSFLRRHTGYVEQFDTLCDNLTVYENLLYTAEMKLPRELSLEEKKRRVDALIETLSLEVCRNTLIGNSQRKGVSGGQAKRVNIGVSIISDPKVLYLDEPTTGLDSFTSDALMHNISHLCEKGLTVCATIHSPSPFCFRLFSSLLLLAGGDVVYFGPANEGLISYFEASSIGSPKTSDVSDAEWVINFVTGAVKDQKVSILVEEYAQSQLCKNNEEEQAKLLKFMHMAKGEGIDSAELDIKDPRRGKPTAVSMSWAIRTMFRYRVLKNYQDGMFLSARIVDKLISLGIIITLFQGLGDSTDPVDMTSVAAGLFMYATSPALTAGAYLPTIMLERPLYYRERADGLYYSFTYLIVKWIQEVILVIPTSFLLSMLVYFSMKLQGFYITYWLNYMLSMLTSIALAYLVACSFPSFKFANSAVPFYGGTLLYFVGFFIPVKDIPGWWIWFAYLDHLRYPWSAMMAENFDNNEGTLAGSNQTIIEFYRLEGVNPLEYTPAILPFFVTFVIMGAVCLKFLHFGNR